MAYLKIFLGWLVLTVFVAAVIYGAAYVSRVTNRHGEIVRVTVDEDSLVQATYYNPDNKEEISLDVDSSDVFLMNAGGQNMDSVKTGDREYSLDTIVVSGEEIKAVKAPDSVTMVFTSTKPIEVKVIHPIFSFWTFSLLFLFFGIVLEILILIEAINLATQV